MDHLLGPFLAGPKCRFHRKFLYSKVKLSKTDHYPVTQSKTNKDLTKTDRKKYLNTHKTNHTNKTQVRREEKTQGHKVNTIG